MKFKRLATMALAGAMSLSLAVPAFASGSTEVTATYSSPVISVDVPAKGAVVINPFGLDVEVSENAADTTNTNKVTISGQKIVTAPMALKNKTKMNLGVNVTMTGAVKDGSTMRLAIEAPAADDSSKSAFVYLQAASATTLTGDESTITAAKIAEEFAKWEPAAYSADNDLILDVRAASKDNIVTLKAAKMDNTGAFDEYKAGSIAFVRLAGDCVASPRTAWANTDGFTANIAYTFAPVQIPTFDITEGTKGTEGSANSATAMAFKVDSAAVTKAAAGDTVTVEVTVADAADAVDWTVVDAEGNAIAGLTGNVAAASGTTRTFTFTMPAQAVKVNIVSK